MSKSAIALLIIVAVAVGVIVGAILGMPRGTGIVAALREILKAPATTLALISSITALVSAVIGPMVTLRIGRGQVAAAKTSANAAMATANASGTRALAAMRLDWIKALRDNLAEYHGILMSSGDHVPTGSDDEAKAARAKFDADERRMAHLGTHLDFLLNQTDPLQKKLWEISDDIMRIDGKGKRWERDKELVEAARAVFEEEWKKIESEILCRPESKAHDADPAKPSAIAPQN